MPSSAALTRLRGEPTTLALSTYEELASWPGASRALGARSETILTLSGETPRARLMPMRVTSSVM
eukprot:293422-Pyramimonas_sp.AAC.1